MLFSVEGGGFFSSPATGYSKGLSLLLLGYQNEERPVRVLPWNQYRLVDQEVESDLQLASRKKQASCGCTSFICFSQASFEHDAHSPSKPPVCVQQPEHLTNSSSTNEGKFDDNVAADEDKRKVCRRSSLKKQSRDCPMVINTVEDVWNSLEEVQSGRLCGSERRKVHWTDACGRELAEIREFEVSDKIQWDEEASQEGCRRCQCVIQ